MYVDGVLSAVGAESSSEIPPYAARLWVGCQQRNGIYEFFVGKMDEVAIWMRPLSAEQVLTWYDATKP